MIVTWELARTETASSGCEGEMAVDFSQRHKQSSSVSLPFLATQLMEFGLLLYFNTNYTFGSLFPDACDS